MIYQNKVKTMLMHLLGIFKFQGRKIKKINNQIQIRISLNKYSKETKSNFKD